MLGGLFTIQAGILAIVDTRIASRSTEAKGGGIAWGVVLLVIGFQLLFWGLWEAGTVFTSLGTAATDPLRFVFWAATAAVDLALGGMLLASGLGQLRRRPVGLGRLKVPLGLLGVASGVAYIVWLFS